MDDGFWMGEDHSWKVKVKWIISSGIAHYQLHDATKNYCTLFSSKNRNEWNHKKMLLRMRSNTVKLKKKQKHTTEWPYTATVYLFDTLRMRRNTVKLEQLSRQDHRTEVECRGNNNNHTKPVSKSVRIEMICKYCACFLHQSINQSCQIRSLALFAIPLGFIY